VLRNSNSAPDTDEQLSDELSVPRKRVLVADDQTRILEAVTELLEESFDVIGVVSDGRTALEATLALEPDLVVLDISMPVMNGIEVAREIRRCSSKAKIVFLTVHEDAQILAGCLAAGGLGYIIKDLMNSDLIPAMNDALSDRAFVSRFSSEQGTSANED
jgi:DNA-binding NarL/FixJ family response regulator